MKRLFYLFFIILTSINLNAENVNVTGLVHTPDGNAVANQLVFLNSTDSISGYYYFNEVMTNDAGEFADVIHFPGDITQGSIIASTLSCNTMITQVEYFNPGNTNLSFDLEVCENSGGGNDSISCENYFYYDIEGTTVNFTGVAYPEENVSFSWTFGDGSSGDGMEISHEYTTDGLYEVTLTTLDGNNCTALSMEFLIIGQDTTGGGNDSTLCENFFYYEASGNTAMFYGISYPEDASFSWDFGDGTTGEGMEISHEYSNEGMYEVSLVTTAGNNCTAMSMDLVFIGQDSTGGGNDSTLCENFFYYEANGNSAMFYGMSYPEDALFSWDFGDGNSGEGMEISHEYTNEGMYMVTLTTTANDSCTAISMQEVYIGETISGQEIFGTVYAGNNPLDYGLVLIFSANDDSTGNGNCYQFNVAEIDSLGSYYFESIPDGDYYILAFPDDWSGDIDEYLPTYYGDAIFWEDATIVSLGNAANPYDIHLVLAEGTADGNGNINGDLVGEDFKSQLDENQISLFLLDENNNALEITYSQLNSDFDFSNLAYGTYIVYAEITGLPTEAAVITLSADNPSANVTIEITANGATTGIGNHAALFAGAIGAIYPNPVSNQAQIQISMEKQTTLNILIYNQIGQIVHSTQIIAAEGSSVVTIPTKELKHGVYNLQFMSEDGTSFIQKFIK